MNEKPLTVAMHEAGCFPASQADTSSSTSTLLHELFNVTEEEFTLITDNLSVQDQTAVINSRNQVSTIAEMTRGKWGYVLNALGIIVDEKGGHTACPICGGKDRFRFDDLEGRGTSFCNQCPEQSRDGLALVRDYYGCDIKEAANKVADTLNVTNDDHIPNTPSLGCQKEKLVNNFAPEFDLLPDADSNHPYLLAKKLTSDGLKQQGGALVVPAYNAEGVMTGLQRLFPNGDKPWFKGSTKRGSFLALGEGGDYGVITEGWGTGRTIYEQTDITTYVAFDAGNIKNIVPVVAEKHDYVFIASDFDMPGFKALEEAQATAPQAPVLSLIPPEDGEIPESGGTDWSDLYLSGQPIKAIIEANIEAEIGEYHQASNPVDAENASQDDEQEYPDFGAAIQALEEDKYNERAFDAVIGFIHKANFIDVGRMRHQLKDITGVDIADIKAAVKERKAAEEPIPLTHGEMADKYIEKLGDVRPIGEYGRLWLYNENNGIWVDTALSRVGVAIAKLFKTEDRCKRETDYKAIASHSYNTVEQKGFFANAPKGIYAPSGFICVQNRKLMNLPPSPEHHARFRLEIEPVFGREPELLLGVLREAFDSTDVDGQIRQLRMLTGLSLLGLQAQTQRAIFLFGAGGSGKSLYLKILEALVPSEYRASVSPHEMDNDYKVASLAGKLLNLVPEIDKDKPVPSAAFKAITGGDTKSAREPYGKVFTFIPDAGCWFNGNFFLTTKDHSEGFWRRWAIIHFANSKPESERDPTLVDRIIDDELPAILGWAIMGVKDYLDNGLYLSATHYKCLNEWQREGDSVACWLNDDDSDIGNRKTLKARPPLKVSHAYTIYHDWCRHNNRKPYSKQQFKAYMANHGHVASLNSGYSCYPSLYDDRSLPRF
ncbi:phage/plasmid primase, P4 family [Photobacterium chitinilyticum]|nr:phage/plasmid primase, P4 family [Photobacterium chitinilyticum]